MHVVVYRFQKQRVSGLRTGILLGILLGNFTWENLLGNFINLKEKEVIASFKK